MSHEWMRRVGIQAARGNAGEEGGGGEESLGLVQSGGAWFVETTAAPDGYFVENDGKLEIDDAAESGLAITHDGPLIVNT